jgi:hypothetical protein
VLGSRREKKQCPSAHDRRFTGDGDRAGSMKQVNLVQILMLVGRDSFVRQPGPALGIHNVNMPRIERLQENFRLILPIHDDGL